jgi:transposase
MVRIRELTENEAKRLQRIVRRGARDIVTCWRATVVLASAQGQKVAVIAKLVQTSEDRVREMIRNFNEAGMDSLSPSGARGARRPSRPR